MIIWILTALTLFRAGLFGAAHGWGGAKSPPPYNLSHIPCKDETWHSYTLPKEDSKIYESCDSPLEFCWHQHFFIGNQQI